jgi:exportin-2 (importin alpha re-exporter)
MTIPPPYGNRPTALNELVKLFHEPQHLAAKTGDDDANAGYTEIDYEEQTAGYQAAFSKLASSEGAPTDYVSYVGSVQAFVGQQLANMTRVEPQTKALLLAGDASIVRPFLRMVGYDI